jgi:hypothetical protein
MLAIIHDDDYERWLTAPVQDAFSPGALALIASAWMRSANRSASAWFTIRWHATRD